MYSNPKWLNDVLRTGDKIIQDGEASRDRAEATRKLLDETLAGAEGNAVTSSGTTLGEIMEGIQTLIALAVGVLGLFVGGASFGWIGALVLGAVGFIGTVFLFAMIDDKFGNMAENRLWKKRPPERTRDELLGIWESKFGSPLHQEVIDEIDLNGAAWVMDKKANFILRLHNGERLYVGYPDGSNALLVEMRGGKGVSQRDAWLMMLARKSAGAKACRPRGDDKSNAHLWAAARILGLEVHGYKPDAYALEAHQKMKKDYKETRP